MNKIIFLVFALPTLLFLSACEGLEEDARDTPIGGIVSGRTASRQEYVEEVHQRNKASERDNWRPEQTGF